MFDDYLWHHVDCSAFTTSVQCTTTIRRSLTPTTFSYPCSHSLTNEHSDSRVSRSEGEGEEWVKGLGGCWLCEIAFGCMREPYSYS
jgi:hypothetical protein